MKVFLETSTQIQRLLHTKARMEYIQRHLSSKSLCTSDYVYMEFRRVILQNFAYVKTLLQRMLQEGIRNIDISDFFVQLSESRGLFNRPRAIQCNLLVVAAIAREFQGESLPTLDLLDFLDFQMEYLEKIAFFQGISEVIVATNCDLIKPQIPVGDLISTRISCNAKTAQCRLVELVLSNYSELSKISQALEREDPRTRDSRAMKALRRIIDNPNKALGERTCWALGDVIVALSAPDDAYIYTVDRHFEVILSSLGKKLFVEKK